MMAIHRSTTKWKGIPSVVQLCARLGAQAAVQPIVQGAGAYANRRAIE
ncbi:hypothetical protein ACQEVF_28545 [Nonomuraea polychroma]